MLHIDTILHPTDFSDRSRTALYLACALARDHGARLILLHVAPGPPVFYGDGAVPVNRDQLLQEAWEQLEGLEVPGARGIQIDRRIEEGEAAAEILRVAAELQASLIVLGTHGRRGLARLLMGSVAEAVMRRAECPVLTVKNPLPDTALEPVSATAQVVATPAQ